MNLPHYSPYSLEANDSDLEIISIESRITPPACKLCGAPARLGVVWFGEMLPS